MPNRNNLQRHESRDRAKWIITFISIILVVVAVAAAFVGIFTDGFKDWNKIQPPEQQEPPTITDGNGDEMENGGSYAMPTAMVYTAGARGATPATSITVTATLTPSTAVDKAVDWTVSFANPSSTWASGKNVTDYVSIDDTESLTNTVTFSQAFGEQIILTVTSQDNPEAQATCTIDCAQKLQSANVTFAVGSGLSGDTAVTLNSSNGTSANWATFRAYLSGNGNKAAQVTHNTTTVYTIEDSYSTVITIAPSSELLAAARNISSSATSGTYTATNGITPNRAFFSSLFGTTFAASDVNLYKLGKLLDSKSMANPFVVTVRTTGEYTDDVVNTYYMAYTAASIGSGVTGIEIGNGTIIF